MTIYVVMVKDRHMDPDAHLFTTAEKALAFAKEYLAGCGDYVEESEIEGWLFYATYGSEGDSIWIVEKELE